MKQTLRKTFALKALMFVTMLVGAINGAWADEVYYTLDTSDSANKTNSNSYAGSGTVTVDGIEWTCNGNGTMNPWRLGGKSISNTDRVVYTNTAMGAAISQVDLTIGTADNITVNSLKLIVANDANFTNVIEEVSARFAASSTISFKPTKVSEWAKDVYYKFVFNVTVSASSNKFVQFSKVEFYKANDSSKQDITLTFPESDYQVNLGENFTAPQLTKSADVTVAYSSSKEAVATVDASTGAVTVISAGVTTITASFDGDDTYNSASTHYTLTVIDPNANDGSEEHPYTVAEALAAIDAGIGITGVYATGIVSEIVTEYSSQYGNISYNISDDGSTTSDQLQAYRGKSYNGDNFTSADDIQVGDVVVIYGDLTLYNNTTYEFKANNQLVKLTREEPFSFGETTAFTIKLGDSFTAPTLSYAEGFDGTVTYTSSNEAVATVAEDGTVTVKGVGQTTITASSAKTESFNAGEASYTLTVNPAEAYDNDFAFTAESVQIEVGATQTLGYTTSSEGAITWESSNTDVATVDREGNVTAVTVGEAVITATQAATDTYKAGSVQITVNVVAKQPVEVFDLTTGFDDATVVTNIEGDVVTLTFGKGTNSSNSPKYYNNGTAVRMYSGNILTVASDIAVVKIEFTLANESNKFKLAEDSEGSYENYIWTGTATEVVFISEGKPYVKQVKVFYDGNAKIREAAGLAYAETEFTVAPNAEFTVPELTNPNNLSVTYSSSDEEIALVDAKTGEVVIGEKEGTATITASFAGNDDYKAGSASYTITVADTREPANIAFGEVPAFINIDETATYVATSTVDNATISYASSNEDIVMVDATTGEIAALAVGTATIIATVAETEEYKSNTASYTITVVDPNVESETIDLTQQNFENDSKINVVYGANVAIQGHKNTNRNSPKYLTNGNAVRCYGGNIINVASATKALASVTITFADYDNNDLICQNAAYTTTDTGNERTWTATAPTNSVMFQVDGTSGHCRITKVSVTYTDWTSYSRTVTEGAWGTIFLPCDARVTGANLYTIAGVNAAKTYIILEEASSIEAGNAYIFQATSTELKATFTGDFTSDVNEGNLVGSPTGMVAPEGCYLLSKGEIVPCGTDGAVLANRAYIDLTNAEVKPDNVEGAVKLFFNGAATAINSVNAAQLQGEAYDLTGRRVKAVKGGLYIVNGKKIVK